MASARKPTNGQSSPAQKAGRTRTKAAATKLPGSAKKRAKGSVTPMSSLTTKRPTATRSSRDRVSLEPEAFSLPKKPQALMNVSFNEAMQVGPLLGEVSQQVQADLLKTLATHGGDVMAAALTGAALVVENGTQVIRFTEAGSKLLKAKELRFMADAAGRKLPTLVNASGKVVENARVMGPLTKGTRIAANLSMAVVTVAHIVSGHDLSKKLNKIGEKVDFLVAAHRISQLARIEAVYRQAKEILYLPQTEQTRRELHGLGRELFEVRSAWRQEMLYHLGTAQKTEESQNKIIAWLQGFWRKGKDDKIVATASSAETEIQLISSSFAIHLALAQAAGTLDTYLRVSLGDELAELGRVGDQLRDRKSWIHAKHPDCARQIQETYDKLETIRKVYGSMAVPKEPAPRLVSEPIQVVADDDEPTEF